MLSLLAYSDQSKYQQVHNKDFHPSGHILGSSQIKFIFAEEKWLISGDFKLQKDQTCKQYEIVKTDYLIANVLLVCQYLSGMNPIK